MPSERFVATPRGEARLVMRRADRPVATLVLTHGAGGGIDARDLLQLSRRLPAQGINVALVEMPWRRAGARLAPRPEVIDSCYRAVLDTVRVRTPLVVGGRSAGARAACRLGRRAGASGVLALAFPLHPPGRPERSRVEELTGARVPVLVVQGTRDPFGRPEEFPQDTELVAVPGGDHGFAVPRRADLGQEDALAVLQEGVLEWLVREVSGA